MKAMRNSLTLLLLALLVHANVQHDEQANIFIAAPDDPRFAETSRECNSTACTAVRLLIARFLPQHSHSFLLEIINVTSSNITAYFTISQQPCSSAGRCVLLQGMDAVSLSSGFHWYLKYVANSSVSWLGDQLDQLRQAPSLPLPADTIRMQSQYAYRYYFNPVTFAYSTFAWDWPRWQREIDWMAMIGVNAPLAFVGQEYIEREVFLALGFSDSEIRNMFTGPAFLPWNRLGNLDTWQGPLPLDFIQNQHDLQIQILEQMRALGMTPILPAFNGAVPPAFSSLFPRALMRSTASWEGFEPAFLLDPTDPMFNAIQQQFIASLVTEYGSDHVYAFDLFNEAPPPNTTPEYLYNLMQGVYKGLQAADPEAVWVMQGWCFFDSYWNNDNIEALLHGVPRGNLIVLDLFADVLPLWNTTQSFFNTPFIWSMLHNFGGRSGMYGRANQIASSPALALAANQNQSALVGLGLTMEAIGYDPMIYDLMTENIYRGEVGTPDLLQWLESYVFRRYAGGADLPSPLFDAWNILLETVYSCNSTQHGTSASVFTSRPDFNISHVTCCANVMPYYNTSLLKEALSLMLEAGNQFPSLTNQSTYQYDLVLLTSQVMSNMGYKLSQQSFAAYLLLNVEEYQAAASLFLELIQDMDALVGTQEEYLFGKWVLNATRLAQPFNGSHDNPHARCATSAGAAECGFIGIEATACEELNCCFNASLTPMCFSLNNTDEQLYRLNARTQVTLWGFQANELTDYAGKLWQGLLSGYYYQRWSMFFGAVIKALQEGQQFQMATFVSELQDWEEGWVHEQTNDFKTEPQGSAFEIASSIYAKYF
eukprot:m.329171 g.329171  ORF g.329171 m.329171 type:complete len:823 (+) comp55597_c0_seq2:203-2671(+)